MLDTYGRKYVNPLIDCGAKTLLHLKFSANQVTIAAFMIGVLSGPFISLGFSGISLMMIWFSGYLDAVDGAMARKSNTSSPWGTLLDIVFDRLVEMSIVLGIALRYPNVRFELLVLVICILISMTIFLTVGALAKQKGFKAFYYQAGLAERTEGFIMFSLMILFPSYIHWMVNIFSAMIVITIIQRSLEAKKILKD